MKRSPRPDRRLVLAWHRRLGLASAGFVVLIAVTGIFLNHGPELKLDERRLAADWLFRWYGIAPQGEPVGYPAGDDWIVTWDGQVFLGETAVGEMAEVAGAGVVSETEYLVAGRDRALVISPAGAVLEQLDALSLPPGPIVRAGTIDAQPAFETADGRFLLHEWIEIVELTEADAAKAMWFAPVNLPEAIRAQAGRAFRGEGFPVSRILLDLHSGRFFGRAGVIVYDVAAVLFLILAATGIWLGIRRKRSSASPS